MQLRVPTLPRHPAAYAIGAFSAIWALIAVRLGSLRHDRFGTFGFDLAIHDQAIWLLAHGRDPFITIRGMDTFGHHFTPIYWLLAPIYWAGGGPHALLVLQTASQVLAAVALYLLTIDLLGRAYRWLGALFAAAFLLHPTNSWLVWEFFHPELMALGPLLMAYRAARTERWRAFLLWGLVAAASKEDMMLALAMIGLSVVLPSTAHRRRGLLIFAGWAVSYLVVTRVLGTWRAGGPPPYETYYQPYGDSQFSVLFHFISHPADIARVLFDHDRLAYYRAMLVPAGLVLPLLGWRGFAIGLPVLFGNVATGPGYPYTHDYRLHYSTIVLGAVFLGLVEGAALIQRAASHPRAQRASPSLHHMWWAIPVVLVVGCSVFSYRHWSIGPGSEQYRQGAWPILPHESTWSLLGGTIDTEAYGNIAARNEALARIPAGAPVSALYNFDAHLAHREGIYEWPNPWVPVNWGLEFGKGRQADPASVEYIILELDITFGSDAARTDSQAQELELFNHLTSREFEIIFDKDRVVVARRHRPAECFTMSGGLASRMTTEYQRRDTGVGDATRTRLCPT